MLTKDSKRHVKMWQNSNIVMILNSFTKEGYIQAPGLRTGLESIRSVVAMICRRCPHRRTFMWESTDHRWIPLTKIMRSFENFFVANLKKLLKPSRVVGDLRRYGPYVEPVNRVAGIPFSFPSKKFQF